MLCKVRNDSAVIQIFLDAVRLFCLIAQDLVSHDNSKQLFAFSSM